MAPNTKYQAAPQRDSFDEEPNYTQAPPSYQAAGPSDHDGLLGAPRGEDDNVPDDFKVRKWTSASCLSLPDLLANHVLTVRRQRLRSYP